MARTLSQLVFITIIFLLFATIFIRPLVRTPTQQILEINKNVAQK
jgi:hypothetical protein